MKTRKVLIALLVIGLMALTCVLVGCVPIQQQALKEEPVWCGTCTNSETTPCKRALMLKMSCGRTTETCTGWVIDVTGYPGQKWRRDFLPAVVIGPNGRSHSKEEK